MKPITRTRLPHLQQCLQMKTRENCPPTLSQWLTEHRHLLKDAKKKGYSPEDMVAFLNANDVPSTTKIIEKASGRGLTEKTRKLAKQISLSPKQYAALTEAFIAWSAQSNVLSKEEVIGELKGDIKAALSKGYDFDDIAEILTLEGHAISGGTVKSYYQKLQQAASAAEEIPQPQPEPTAAATQVAAVTETPAPVREPEPEPEPSSGVEVVAAPPMTSEQPSPPLSAPTTAPQPEKTEEHLTRQTNHDTHPSRPQPGHHKPLKHLPVYDDEAELEKLFNL